MHDSNQASNLKVDYDKNVLRCNACNKFVSPAKLLDYNRDRTKAGENQVCYHCDKHTGVGAKKRNEKSKQHWLVWILNGGYEEKRNARKIHLNS